MPAFRAWKIPKRLDAGNDIKLDLLTITRWRVFYSLLKNSDTSVLNKLGFARCGSILQILLLSIRLFSWAYIIKRGQIPIGIVGAYQWQPGVHLFLTLAIFNKASRNRGVGSAVVKALAQHFKKSGVCRRMFVEVKRDNKEGLRFWKKNGFCLVSETCSTLIFIKEFK